MHWETLHTTPSALVRRAGRFVVAELLVPHRVFSTSVRNGGQRDDVVYLLNHQSCEGAGHETRGRAIVEQGQEGYHDAVCGEAGISPVLSATMGTAANMHYVAIADECDEAISVTAVVTAGVQTNAVCAGDPAAWRESEAGIVKVALVAGTINTMLLVNVPVTASVLARTVVTMTEGKSAALQQLAVPSCYSRDLATGTGTDQFCLAAPLSGAAPLTSGSPHMKFGELVGLAVRKATAEAIRWQNGLEPSYTRGLFHALSRYGLKQATIQDDMAPLLSAADLELLRRNSNAVFYEPLVGAAAHALATVFDRVRHGTLPASVLPDAVVQQAATLAVGLAAQPHRWAEFRTRLHAGGVFDAKGLVLAALALGWSEKWRSM